MNAPAPGAYRREAGGVLVPVHVYLDDHYGLDDVVALLAIGTPLPTGGVEFTRADLRLLAATAHAQSFDHDEDFIRMCLDIAGQDLAPEVDRVTLVCVD